ncbi:hypothetical protein B0H17DRAFT_537654 [Mycena rosella]|uniref:Uncharacterized protein n=1 Tax=Mycena rosella TaxID=1033263 RepID=A0AAD7DLX2_MYCRO|nr:hypothetical protein B0H17DRAFT_537654 [Mycena rosella]
MGHKPHPTSDGGVWRFSSIDPPVGTGATHIRTSGSFHPVSIPTYASHGESSPTHGPSGFPKAEHSVGSSTLERMLYMTLLIGVKDPLDGVPSCSVEIFKRIARTKPVFLHDFVHNLMVERVPPEDMRFILSMCCAVETLHILPNAPLGPTEHPAISTMPLRHLYCHLPDPRPANPIRIIPPPAVQQHYTLGVVRRIPRGRRGGRRASCHSAPHALGVEFLSVQYLHQNSRRLKITVRTPHSSTSADTLLHRACKPHRRSTFRNDVPPRLY